MTSASALPLAGSRSRGFQTGSASADDQRGHQQTQQRQPPRALMRRLLASSAPGKNLAAAERLRSAACGGVRRSSHQMTGSASSPHRTAGKPKAKRQRSSWRGLPPCVAGVGGHRHVDTDQRFGGEPVGMVDGVAPAEPLAQAHQLLRGAPYRQGGSRRAAVRRGRRSVSRRSRGRGIRCGRHRGRLPRRGRRSRSDGRARHGGPARRAMPSISSGGSRKSLASTMSEKRRMPARSGLAGRLTAWDRCAASRSAPLRARERVGQAGPGDALAAARQKFGQGQHQHQRAGFLRNHGAGAICRAWRARGRPRARPYGRPPIRGRGHRCGRRGRSGASRCATWHRRRHRAGTARNSRRCRACGGRASRRSPC